MAQPEYGARYLKGGRVRRRSVDDDRVLHGAGSFERGHQFGDSRGLLTDPDVDALHAETLLVDDRVDRDRGLAGLAVADDQLALAAADRRHGVDDLDAGLQRLLHRLAVDDAGSLDLDAADRVLRDRALAVERSAERVDDATEEAVTDGDFEDAAGRLDGLAFLDVRGITEEHCADRLLVEVEGDALHAALELEQFVDRRAGEAADAGDTVAHFDDATDLRGRGRRSEVRRAACAVRWRCRRMRC